MNAIQEKIYAMFETGQLVRAAQAGDAEAFGELFERFQPSIMAVAMRRMRNYAEAQELTQDVFVQAMNKLDQLRTPEAFIGWLRQIAVRMAINRCQRNRHALAVEPEMLEATLTGDDTPDEFAMEIERREQVRDGLDRLGEMDRDTLVAFYFDGQSLIEMAERFDAPLGTIKRRLHVARKRLVREVEDLAVV